MKKNVNINVKNIKKHFLSGINEKKEINEAYVTEIKKCDFVSLNEASVSDKIRKINYYSNNYILVHEYDFINIGELTNKTIKKINIDSKKNEYLIFKYKRYNLIGFYDFLFNYRDNMISKKIPKNCFFHILESFSYILKGLLQINQIGICYFNLCPDNIVFNLDVGEKAQIKRFNLSLELSKLNEKYIIDIIKCTSDYSYKPLEIHLLFYLIENDIITISYSFIEEISIIFVKNLTILQFFSDKYKESYKLGCIESLKKYINLSRSEIILDILDGLKNSNKLDIYSFSLLYIDIFGNFLKIFSLKSKFINKIIIYLSKNIHPDPLNRNSIKDLLEYFEQIVNEEKDWSFINDLPNNKMDEFESLLI